MITWFHWFLTKIIFFPSFGLKLVQSPTFFNQTVKLLFTKLILLSMSVYILCIYCKYIVYIYWCCQRWTLCFNTEVHPMDGKVWILLLSSCIKPSYFRSMLFSLLIRTIRIIHVTLRKSKYNFSQSEMKEEEESEKGKNGRKRVRQREGKCKTVNVSRSTQYISSHVSQLLK